MVHHGQEGRFTVHQRGRKRGVSECPVARDRYDLSIPHALAIASFLSLVVFGIGASRGADKSKSDGISKQGASAKMDVIEIIPGRSIGAVALGASTESLPKGATVGELDGSYMGISFTHKGGKIDDVWIDDLQGCATPSSGPARRFRAMPN